ncbi:MAG: CRISPR-associated endonuclease Cas1 [Deltaproteobacteria bacterium]|nr:MAG: CRISPR-associated endonuclease Cas1 [Deltaproteobacteria bacterium]
MVIYVRTQGARIVKEGKHLLVKKGETIYHTLFTYKLRQVVIFGSVEITHRALVQLMRHNVDIVFMTYNGRYLGRIAPPESKNVFLHKRQYKLLDDYEFGLRLARSIVAGKLANMATLLMRIKRSKKDSLAGQKAKEIQMLMEKLEAADNIESIRGYEGKGSALYFEGFSRGFIQDMGFRRRVRRPPTDPVNSVLSLLYTFLMNRVYAAIRITGLDPYPGFLHTIDYGRYSLVLDLMEEFRPIIADTLTLSLFNLKILQNEDFYVERPESIKPSQNETDKFPDVTRDPIGLISLDESGEDIFDLPEQRIEESISGSVEPMGKYPVKLNGDAFNRVIEAFEKKLTTSFYYPPAERKLTYGDAIYYQAGLLRKVIEGEVKLYQPLLLK